MKILLTQPFWCVRYKKVKFETKNIFYYNVFALKDDCATPKLMLIRDKSYKQLLCIKSL